MQGDRPESFESNQQIEDQFARTFGAPQQRFRVADSMRKYEIDICAVPGSPEPHLSSLGTIGLCQTPLLDAFGVEQPRIELTGIFETVQEGAREVLASAAFRLMRTHKPLRPGMVFLNCLHDWYPKASVPHLYFVQAHRWSFPRLKPLAMGTLQVQFLQAIPITESECMHVEEHGGTSLESCLLGASVSIWDLRRSPCV